MSQNNLSFSNISWTNTLFIVLSPILAIGLTITNIYYRGWDVGPWVLFIIFYFVTGLSITAGYHRLYAHKAYEANKFLKFLFLVFGAAALQNSLLKWGTDHRRHHKEVDSDQDPYSIKKGFFFAHMGWLFFKDDREYDPRYSADFERDPLVMWQHRNYLWLAFLFGFGLPTLIGYFMGNALGALAIAGFLRVVFTHHCTFFVNSLAHTWGTQTYTDKNSARDNFVIALLTYGEGYHNFHHRFEADFRNGLKWYQYDPTKWLIQSCSWVGMTQRLKRVPDTEIFKARLRMEELKVSSKLSVNWEKYETMVTSLREKVETAQLRARRLKEEYKKMKKEFSAARDEKLATLRMEMRFARVEFQVALREWRGYTRVLRTVPV